MTGRATRRKTLAVEECKPLASAENRSDHKKLEDDVNHLKQKAELREQLLEVKNSELQAVAKQLELQRDTIKLLQSQYAAKDVEARTLKNELTQTKLLFLNKLATLMPEERLVHWLAKSGLVEGEAPELVDLTTASAIELPREAGTTQRTDKRMAQRLNNEERPSKRRKILGLF